MVISADGDHGGCWVCNVKWLTLALDLSSTFPAKMGIDAHTSNPLFGYL